MMPALAPTDVPTVAVPDLLYVDVDGTLIRSDLLVESALSLVFRNPLWLFALVFWLIKGKANLKSELVARVRLDPTLLPYRADFLEWTRAQQRIGRTVVLASASHQTYVQQIADHLEFDSTVLASSDTLNLSGAKKVAAIKAHSHGRGFDYAGNAAEDLHVWKESAGAILVNAPSGVEYSARRLTYVVRIFRSHKPGLRIWAKAVRVHQWVKNLLIAVPLLTAFQFADISSVLRIVAAIIAFSLVASATYLANDLADLQADRKHVRKCKRAFASGDIGILQGILVGVLLLATGLTIAAKVSLPFFGAVIVYLLATLSYSLKLKQFILIDVICLAGLYTWRIIAGALAINVEMSNWLAGFSLFVFLSLALVKRCSELVSLEQQFKEAAHGRDYRVADGAVLAAMGISSGFVAVLVLALFIDAPTTAMHYSSPRVLWVLCPLMLYWIGRIWVKTARGEMHDDPIVFSAKDRASWVILACIMMITYLGR